MNPPTTGSDAELSDPHFDELLTRYLAADRPPPTPAEHAELLAHVEWLSDRVNDLTDELTHERHFARLGDLWTTAAEAVHQAVSATNTGDAARMALTHQTVMAEVATELRTFADRPHTIRPQRLRWLAHKLHNTTTRNM